jgi:hypothetical protein
MYKIAIFVCKNRYISPHSPNVTVLMAVLAQATHDMVPPDALTVGAFFAFFY